ncbi:virulence factor [Rugamonas apoptosis]|uniref:Virulence factor n=1 Tax=Rugamonas apoptosis TaxID=2758570 RepID=A0A7W2FBP5_9BURK|nr:virulence factor [Rugamonas apoptosis]MBA5688718.1 virulence factor [Rugamonas apoptosis]
MTALIAPRPRRIGWALLAFLLASGAMIVLTWLTGAESTYPLTEGEMMRRFLALPALAAISILMLLSACAHPPAPASAATPAAIPAAPPQPFMAQVVGVQWLNPLQRRDYPTEWQLLWTLGLVKPNQDDDMVRTQPKRFSTLQAVAPIAAGNNGKETFEGYHEKYVTKLISMLHDIYFSSSHYFYNAHSLEDKATWRELAGIHVEYALPEGRLNPAGAVKFAREFIIECFDIGNVNFPTAWTRNTPPDVRVTMGGPNAGFTSLAAALDHLRAHPNETVWVMNWDAPSFPPKDEQINENMVLLVLAGPHYKTERDALAWIGYPASAASADFPLQQGQPSRLMQAWHVALDAATRNADKKPIDIGYAIYDANTTHADSPHRIGHLAQLLTLEVPEFDFMKQAFNTPALLGEMGASTALTNVALGIAYANHFGKNVLVAGTTDPERPTAVLVAPPAKERPIDANEPWFRARGENNAYLMWWGIRHDAPPHSQGYSK